MDYLILGPLEVGEEGTSLALGGVKERAVLAVLLLHPNEVVSVDRLIDSLWTEEAPAGAINTVQTYVSRLRKVLPPGALVTRRPGYLLEVEPGQLDAARFASGAAEGREALARDDCEKAEATLREALALWRGPALADFTYEPFARAEIARLEEARLAALEDRLEADLGLGRHREVVGELQTLVASHPLRERMHTQLMLALYRCGRQGDALDAYQGARRVLVEELGAEPGPALRRMHERVLRQDPSLQPPKPAPPNNLPADATSFVGREWELAEIKKLLVTTRLLTVTGVGGAGKTRLAIEAGRGLLHEFSGGVWIAELGALADEAMVAETVATALGVPQQPGDAPSDVLVTALRRRHLLLILDNCEHLIETCARLITTLLSACPELRVLATSREALGVAGETVWHLPPLSFPDETASRDGLDRYEAVRLFAERAAASAPGFRTTDHAVPVARICRRLDGIPLAIELAATRVRLLTPEQIADHLDDRFRLLSRGSRTAPARQQTLRAAVDWSYDLLTKPEQTLFARLSVFAGGFTLDAAEAVCSGEGIDRDEVLELLGRLLDKSLVAVEASKGSARYRLLETLRGYAAERLAESDGADPFAKRHSLYFRDLAESAEPELRGPRQMVWHQRLQDDWDNLRAALTWSLDGGDIETALRTACPLARDRERRGNLFGAWSGCSARSPGASTHRRP